MQPSNSFIKPHLKKLPLRLLVLLALFAGALFLFTFVVHEVLWEKEEQVDNSIFNFLSAHIIDDCLTGFMKTVTYFASATFLLKNVKRAFEIAAIGIGGFGVNYFMKLSFHRIRPPHPLIDPLHNFSFPSGHATSAFIFHGLLAYLIWKSNLSKSLKYIFCTILILFSLLVAFSRVYLRVHYPSDVLAGFCIGFAWLLLTIYLFERLKKKSDKEQKGQTVQPQP